MEDLIEFIMTAFLLKTPPARHIDMIEKIHKWSTMLIEILLSVETIIQNAQSKVAKPRRNHPATSRHSHQRQ